MKKRVFSGIQPTGNVHLGNWLGAIRHWVRLQQGFNAIFCIVDLHALTVPEKAEGLRTKVRELAGILFAAGIDPQISAVSVQSQISAHTELAWILNCFVPAAALERMTQFKEKSKSRTGTASVGLLDYPVLMAADILLYDTDLVPVGEDQKQHIELTRDIAEKMNSRYGKLFTVPEPLIPEAGARLMGLAEPTRKMSKSEDRPGQAIFLFDSEDTIRAKILRAKTDPLREIRFDESRPGIHNLLQLYELLTGRSREEIEDRFSGKGYADLKNELADLVIATLSPMRERYRAFAENPLAVDKALERGAQRVRPIAEKTLARVKGALGL